MSNRTTDQVLWEWLDEQSPELEAHLASHPEDRERVDELRRVVDGCRGTESGSVPLVQRRMPERVGRFRLLQPIGRGGMGVVYEAEQEAPRRRVAVKLLRDAAFEDEDVSQRLAREAEALGRLAHPNIATIYEHGMTEDGEPYLAMELIQGEPLDAWASKRRSRTRDLVEMVERIAKAVHHANTRGIVHRDLKPSNVLVDQAGEPKVLDFGLAHLASTGPLTHSSLTQSGRLLGTPAYMSPEQANGKQESDPRGDVYTLGVILFEVLCGALPYDLSARSLPEAMRVIAEDAPLRLSKIERRLAGDLDVITRKALEKDPQRRYQSAQEMADDLRRHLDGRAIKAVPPTMSYYVRRFAKRHAMGVAAVVAILALVVFGAYAAAIRIDLGALHQIQGDWYATSSPFEALTWDGDVPIVQVEGEWYELVEIDGLQAGYVVGFCKQHAGFQWRKRFREDLLQVLNRMGHWPISSVDLVVKDMQSGELEVLLDVATSKEKRDHLRGRSHNWYFSSWEWTDDGITVELDGKQWELVSVDGVSARELREAVTFESDRSGQPRLVTDLDAVFMSAAKRLPEGSVDVSLRDPVSGESLVLEDIERAGSAR